MSRRIIAVLLASSILFSLAACQNGGQKDDRIEPSTRATESEDNGYISEPNQTIESTLGTTAETTETTAEPETTATASETTTAKPLGKVTIGDAYKKTHGSGKSKYTSKVPKVTIDGVDTAAFNKEILNKFKSTAKDKDFKVWYTYYVGKTYVSIQIEIGFMGEETGGDAPNDYYAYNVSRKTGKKLTRAQMLKELKVSNSKYNKRVKKAVIKWWKKLNGKNYLKVIKKMGETREYNNSIKKKTLNKAIPYVNSKGKVCFLIRELDLPIGIGSCDLHGTC